MGESADWRHLIKGLYRTMPIVNHPPLSPKYPEVTEHRGYPLGRIMHYDMALVYAIAGEWKPGALIAYIRYADMNGEQDILDGYRYGLDYQRI